MKWQLHKYTRTSACRCLKVLKSKAKDNQSETVSVASTYNQPVVPHLCLHRYPLCTYLSSLGPVGEGLLTVSSWVLPNLNRFLLKETQKNLMCLISSFNVYPKGIC